MHEAKKFQSIQSMDAERCFYFRFMFDCVAGLAGFDAECRSISILGAGLVVSRFLQDPVLNSAATCRSAGIP